MVARREGDLLPHLENDKETELLRREGSPSISRGFALSPDGRQLVFGSPWFPGKGVTALHVIPTAGGEPRELLREQDSEDLTRFGMNIRSIWYEWTPDGRYVLFFRSDGAKREYWRVAAEGGEPERLGLESTTLPAELRIAPDGPRPLPPHTSFCEAVGTFVQYAIRTKPAIPACPQGELLRTHKPGSIKRIPHA